MKFKWTSSNQTLIKFLLSLLVIGIILGFIFYYKQNDLIRTSVINELEALGDILKNSKQNNFGYHIILLSVLMVLSIIVLGLPIILFYLFYEGISLGFLLASLWHYKKIEGLFWGLLFGIVNKLFVYLALIYLLIVSIHYSKKMILSIKNKDNRFNEYIVNHLFKIVYIFIFVFIIDIFIYFFGNKILAYFLFLL